MDTVVLKHDIIEASENVSFGLYDNMDERYYVDIKVLIHFMGVYIVKVSGCKTLSKIFDTEDEAIREFEEIKGLDIITYDNEILDRGFKYE